MAQWTHRIWPPRPWGSLATRGQARGQHDMNPSSTFQLLTFWPCWEALVGTWYQPLA